MRCTALVLSASAAQPKVPGAQVLVHVSQFGDAAGLPKLIAALREHGYDDAALRKLGHENWLRVLRKTWK